MKKAELVEALSRYADQRKGSMKGQDVLARFLAHYFSELEIQADQKWDFWDIDLYIPQLLVCAFETFRTSEDETIRQFRALFEEELGRPFTDLTSIWGNGIDQALTVQALGFLFRDIIGAEWPAKEIDMVFNAERHLLEQVFYKFLDQVSRNGLFQIIDESTKRGMSGSFGQITLRTYMMAGRLMLTFARHGEEMEYRVSFVCGDDDALGLGGGTQSVYADLQTAIDMINDVIVGWPDDPSAQAEIFRIDENVSIG